MANIQKQLKTPNEWQLVRTSNLDTIHAICNDASKTHKMVGIIGYTGAGKTKALTSYLSNPNTFYVVCKKTMKPKQFFQKILLVMGINYSGTIYELIERISEELNSLENPLLIIDEAGKLTHTMMLYLHDLRDSTMETTGIILAGVEYFKTNLEKVVSKQKEGMPEFFRRVMTWQVLNPPTYAEIQAICKANGLEDIAAITRFKRISDFGTLQNAIINEKTLTTNQ